MTSKDAIAEDRRDLQRGLLVNGIGYGLKAAHPVLTVFLVRAYGAEVFGLFLATQALLLVLTRVCSLGLDKGFLWWVPQQQEGMRLRGARAAAVYTSATSLLMTLVCLLGAGPIAHAVRAPDATSALRIMSFALLPMTLTELILGATMGTRRMGVNVMVRETLLPMSLVGGGLLLAPLRLGAVGLAIAMVFSHVLGLTVAFSRARRMFRDDSDPETRLRLPSELWRYAWPMWLAEMANTNLQRLDTWAVTALTDLRTVGTGSPRRTAQLRAQRPDLDVVDIRGNVDTRLARVAEGDLDAVLLAAAGLRRLRRADVVTEFLDLDRWPTAPGQGALAVEVRIGEEDLVRALDHAETRAAAEAERHVLAILEAGCSAPVGAHALVDAGLLFLSASVYSLDGTTALTSSHATDWPEADAAYEVAASVARDLLDAGAADLTGADR